MTNHELKLRCYNLTRYWEWRTDSEKKVIRKYCMLASKRIFQYDGHRVIRDLHFHIKRINWFNSLGIGEYRKWKR